MADSPLPAFNHETRAKYTESPNPTFSYGQKVDATQDGKKWVEGEKAGWTVVDPSKEEPQSVAYVLVVLRSSICVCYAERSSFSSQQKDCEQIACFSARIYPPMGLTDHIVVVCAHDQRDRAPPDRVRFVGVGERRREPRALQVCKPALTPFRLRSLVALTPCPLPFPSHPHPHGQSVQPGLAIAAAHLHLRRAARRRRPQGHGGEHQEDEGVHGEPHQRAVHRERQHHVDRLPARGWRVGDVGLDEGPERKHHALYRALDGLALN